MRYAVYGIITSTCVVFSYTTAEYWSECKCRWQWWLNASTSGMILHCIGLCILI